MGGIIVRLRERNPKSKRLKRDNYNGWCSQKKKKLFIQDLMTFHSPLVSLIRNPRGELCCL